MRWAWAHCLVLLVVHAAMTMPGLGSTSLWDMDEGVNAECTREMIETPTWIIPTFNWELRTAKPILLYWLQRPFFHGFGATEFAARFPSVLCGLGTVLLTYLLGRRMSGPMVGLLAGVILATSPQFVILSRAATPDSPLILFLSLAFVLFWFGQDNGRRWWWIPTAAACALAVLTKGPVGVVLPGLVGVLYFVWNREWRRLLDRRIFWAGLVFFALATPWYGFVASESKGEWPAKFFLNDNLGRATRPQEGHGGWPVYYLGIFPLFFAPWSCVLIASFREAIRQPDRPGKFLLTWFGVYFVVFSIVSTKLPNYIGPLYPAAAILTARYFHQWWEGTHTPARWVWPVALGWVVLTGLGFSGGLLFSSGILGKPISDMETFPGLENWAWIGLLPLASALGMFTFLRSDNRTGALLSLCLGTIGFLAFAAYGPPLVVDQSKSAKPLVFESGAYDPDHDIRLASYEYFQESAVFYAQRKIERLDTVEDVQQFLSLPRRGFLFVPAPIWEREFPNNPKRIAARHYDFYNRAEILVIATE